MRGRSNNNNNGGNNNRKGPNPLTRSYESNGPDVKIRGTALHVAEKYSQLARDAHSSGDRVQAENYMQHAEHYYRIIAAAQALLQPTQAFGQEEEREDEDFETSYADRRFDDRNIAGLERPQQQAEPRYEGNQQRYEGNREPRPEGNRDQPQQRYEGNREQRPDGNRDQPQRYEGNREGRPDGNRDQQPQRYEGNREGRPEGNRDQPQRYEGNRERFDRRPQGPNDRPYVDRANGENERPARFERPDRGEQRPEQRQDRAEPRADQAEQRPERFERPERGPRPPRFDRPERAERNVEPQPVLENSPQPFLEDLPMMRPLVTAPKVEPVAAPVAVPIATPEPPAEEVEADAAGDAVRAPRRRRPTRARSRTAQADEPDSVPDVPAAE